MQKLVTVVMKNVLVVAAVGEAAIGMALLTVPSLVARLLLGADLAGAGIVVGRVTGIALIALSVACWPSKAPSSAALCGMATYSLLVTVYLLCLGIQGTWVGPLLWPAVAFHAVLTLLLARAWFTVRSAATTQQTEEVPRREKAAR